LKEIDCKMMVVCEIFCNFAADSDTLSYHNT
jgi:hypothetical protein